VCNESGFCECYKAGLNDNMDEIKSLLDEQGIWVANQNVIERVKFALYLLTVYSDQLSNLRLGLTTVEELMHDGNE